jgi:hypothetical protein
MATSRRLEDAPTTEAASSIAPKERDAINQDAGVPPNPLAQESPRQLLKGDVASAGSETIWSEE